MKSTLCIQKQEFMDKPGLYLEMAAERPISIVDGARLLRLEEVVLASTEVSEHDKTICAALVMDSMVKDIAETEGRKYGDVLKDFMQSRTYDCLFDFETGVWREGPAYLECLFHQELNREDAENVSRNALWTKTEKGGG